MPALPALTCSSRITQPFVASARDALERLAAGLVACIVLE